MRHRGSQAGLGGATGALIAALLVSRAFAEQPQAMTMATFFAFCRSATLADAAVKGTALGWRRMGEEEFASWRSSIERVQHARADAVGWRRSDADDGDTVTYSVVSGDEHYRSCIYATAHPTDALDALRRRLGAPANLHQGDSFAVMNWTAGTDDVYYSRQSAAVLVEIVSRH